MCPVNRHPVAKVPYARDSEVSWSEVTQPLVGAHRTKILRQDSLPVSCPELLFSLRTKDRFLFLN